MLVDGRRRGSAGFIFALGAATLAGAPLALAAPTTEPAVAAFGRRGSAPELLTKRAPDLYVERDGYWVNRFSAEHARPKQRRGSAQLQARSDRIRRAQAGGCLDSTYTDDDINYLLSVGGAGTVVQLCPGAVIQTQNSIVFNAANQEISTQGYPTSNRGKLIVAGANQDVMIYGNCNDCSGCKLRNIEIDGQRPQLGYMDSGAALVEMGGATSGQLLDGNYIHDPRGWSCVHLIEGYDQLCTSSSVTNNQIGPSGTAPNTAVQYRVISSKFQDFFANNGGSLSRRGTQSPGQWADGLSIACAKTTITGNTVTGATDGGIVMFGATGSTVQGNTIISKGNTLMGGVNMVDYGVFNGDYTGTVVSGNTFITDDAMMKIGVAVGILTWSGYNNSATRTRGGQVYGNTFVSKGGSGYFGYGMANAGHDNAQFSGNDFSGALFGGTQSPACVDGWTAPPQAAVFDPYSTTGAQIQANVQSADTLGFLICMMPCQYDATCSASMKLTGPVYLAPSNTSTTSNTTISNSSTTSSVATTTSVPVTSGTTTLPPPVPTSTSNSTPTSTSTSTKASSTTSKTTTATSSKVTSTSSSTTRTSTSTATKTTSVSSPSGMWQSTTSSTTIWITTATSNGKCGAAHGTRTVCPSNNVCSAPDKGASSCINTATSTTASSPPATSPTGMWQSTASSTTIWITTATANGKCGAAKGTRTVCPTNQACSNSKCAAPTGDLKKADDRQPVLLNPTTTPSTLPNGMWQSTASTTTIWITTATSDGKCGAAHGTRTVCPTNQACSDEKCASATTKSKRANGKDEPILLIPTGVAGAREKIRKQIPQKRSFSGAQKEKRTILAYRDWIQAGPVQTPRTFEESRGFDKREVLADPEYWQ